MRRYIVIGYLALLAITIGMVLTLGALVAPVVFHTQTLIAAPLSHYDAGVVMTEIFLRGNTLLGVTLAAVLLYEAYDYKAGRRDMTTQFAAIAVLFSGALFLFYYTPDIVAMQKAMQTESEAFAQAHKGSELDYKLLLAVLSVLLFRRFFLLVRPK